MRCIIHGRQSVAYLRGPVRVPPWPDSRDFCNYFGIILAPFRDKIAATSDQVRFLAGKCSKICVCGPHWGSLQRSASDANHFTVDSHRVRARRVIARTRYIKELLTYLLTSSTIVYRMYKFWS